MILNQTIASAQSKNCSMTSSSAGKFRRQLTLSNNPDINKMSIKMYSVRQIIFIMNDDFCQHGFKERVLYFVQFDSVCDKHFADFG